MLEKELEQRHPQYSQDRSIVNNLASAETTDENLCELARLKIRYQGFPGARDIQKDLEHIMQKWGFPDEESLFAKTRQIYADTMLHQREFNDQDDWI